MSKTHLLKEKWEIIPGYGNRYLVSNYGRIKSLKGREKVLKQSINSVGYYHVCFCYKNKNKTEYTHRLVAKAFIKNKYGKKFINHIDGDKLNNHASNLEWCTQKENINHAQSLGLIVAPASSDSSCSKPINQTKDGLVVAVWPSVIDAMRCLKINNIPKVLSGKNNKSGGFGWEYA